MKYPDPSDYFKAVQMTSSFKIDELKSAEFVKNPPLYLPMPFSGSYAVVFKAIVEGEEQALRFFTREHAPSRERYQALGDYFTSKGISDCMAMSQWVDNAIVIDGQSLPMVQMQWVNGRTLNLHVDSLVGQRDVVAIAGLAAAWRKLINRMQAARFAHGDLQHGNVLVDEKGALRLVDFDCVWIEPFSGKSPPSESGHRNYQRTGRPWGQWMDTFPGLVIYVSLLALSKNLDLWDAFHDGENLLFRQEDFDPPHQTDIWRHLADMGDGQLNRLCKELTSCCVPGWVAYHPLEVLLLPWQEWVKGIHKTAARPAAPTVAEIPASPIPSPPKILLARIDRPGSTRSSSPSTVVRWSDQSEPSFGPRSKHAVPTDGSVIARSAKTVPFSIGRFLLFIGGLLFIVLFLMVEVVAWIARSGGTTLVSIGVFLLRCLFIGVPFILFCAAVWLAHTVLGELGPAAVMLVFIVVTALLQSRK